VVAQVTGVTASPAFWLGTIIASNIPDLDFMVTFLGPSYHRFHRQATHSLLILGALALLVAWGWDWLALQIEPGMALAWLTALLSHPLLDVVTTGPKVAAQGFGIPLLWPVYPRRWYFRKPIFCAAEFKAFRSVRGASKAILSEVYHLGPFSVSLMLLALLF
jgi:membrane-bound metal-dependent hydrolase YbcI (DUF457 family)